MYMAFNIGPQNNVNNLFLNCLRGVANADKFQIHVGVCPLCELYGQHTIIIHLMKNLLHFMQVILICWKKLVVKTYLNYVPALKGVYTI
jgi:hypothetical protein